MMIIGSSGLESKNYAGFYPLGNLVAPKNQLAQIRTVRARNGQNSGKARLKIGGPGGIRTRDLPEAW